MVPSNFIPATYEESRAAFAAYLPVIQSAWGDATWNSHPVAVGEELFIDWIMARGEKNAGARKMLILSTGLHGIEGYAGAMFLRVFMDEYLPRLRPEDTDLLLIHPLNPWGMKMRRRVNQNNVDLNRNFVRGAFVDANPDYARLNGFLNPVGVFSPQGAWLKFGSRLLGQILRLGAGRIKAAMLRGQVSYPRGVYFGGQARQPETQFAMQLLQEALRGCSQALLLDVHTGYGPAGRLTLVNSPLETRSGGTLAGLFGYPLVASANPQEFYAIDGDMVDWVYAWLGENAPQMRFYGTALEYGTLGDSLPAQIISMAATVWENQAFWFGGQGARAGYEALFLPASPAWADSVLSDTRQALDGILRAEGFMP